MAGHIGHVLLLPYPSQGHINPFLQLAKRFAAYDLLTTLAVTRYILNSTQPEPSPVRFAAISDGFDQGGFADSSSVQDYLERFESTGSETLEELVLAESAAGRPVLALIFDAFMPWAGEVGRRLGLATVPFFTQSCAVDAIYSHSWAKRLAAPVLETVELPGLPRLESRDMPSFLSEFSQYPSLLELVMNQYKGLEKADEVLINSFYELEPQEAEYMATVYRAKTVGPTVPSKYLDNRLSYDSHYGFHLYSPAVEQCMDWLAARPPASVVYVAFGSIAELSSTQIAELALGLSSSRKSFLWVVRKSEADKLPEDFARGCAAGDGSGQIVSWAPQLDVLAHDAVGCFVTHCGWNSTLEALSLGVPMVAVPQWSDQTTNAKYVEDVWKVGVRAAEEDQGGEKGVVRREEIERCVREVMEGERSEEMRRNAAKLRELAKKAVDGGSTDKNIADFVAKYCSR